MLIEFLKTKRTKEELKIVLDTVKEFKSKESPEEYISTMFSAWAKLEQFEEYLEYLVNGKELEEDTKKELKKGGIEI